MNLHNLFSVLKGSSRSGNYGHQGRPGKRGGSSVFGQLLSDIKEVNLYMVDPRNNFLRQMMTDKGFNRPPRLVDSLEGTKVYRGVEDPRYVEGFRTGEGFHSGEGGMPLGSGNYFTIDEAKSKTYGPGIIEASLPKDMKTIRMDKLQNLVSDQSQEVKEIFHQDPAIIAVYLGYDAILSTNETNYNILNRSKLLIKK